MLIINKNDVNNLVVSASQHKQSSGQVFYLFSFQHIMSKELVRFFPRMIVNNQRYDEFDFLESEPEDLTLTPPTITFPYEGMYYYSVYEMSSSGQTNPQYAISKVEEGRAVVYNRNVPSPFIQFSGTNDNNANWIFISEDEQPVYPTNTFRIKAENGYLIMTQEGDYINYEH